MITNLWGKNTLIGCHKSFNFKRCPIETESRIFLSCYLDYITDLTCAKFHCLDFFGFEVTRGVKVTPKPFKTPSFASSKEVSFVTVKGGPPKIWNGNTKTFFPL